MSLDDITQGLDEIRRSAFVSGSSKKSYRQASSQEAPRVFAYLDGGSEPSPFPTTDMGSGLTNDRLLECCQGSAKLNGVIGNLFFG